jgi:hypothetical protein
MKVAFSSGERNAQAAESFCRTSILEQRGFSCSKRSLFLRTKRLNG